MIKRVRSHVRTRQHQISVSCWTLFSSMGLLVVTVAYVKMELVTKMAAFSTLLRPGMCKTYRFPFRSQSLRPSSPLPYSSALLAVVVVVFGRQMRLNSRILDHRHRQREGSLVDLARSQFRHHMRLRGHLLSVPVEARTGSALGSSRWSCYEFGVLYPP